MSTPDTGWDVYASDLAEHQLVYDDAPYRRSLYTNTKDDHPYPFTTGEPCGCEARDDSWAQTGAMSVHFPGGDRDPEAG